MTNTKEFKDYLGGNRNWLIQTHNFPDYDAVASAFGLRYLLHQLGIESHIAYGGTLQSESLLYTVEKLSIPLLPLAQLDGRHWSILLVDGHKNNENVTLASGELIGIIDHHETEDYKAAPYTDIDPSLGACSTRIFEYFGEMDLEIPEDVATALLMGIMMDTNSLTRGVSPRDLSAFSRLFSLGDWSLGSYLLNNSLTVKDLPLLTEALSSSRIYRDLCFTSLKKPCLPDMMGIVADFYLRFREIHTVVFVAGDEREGYRCSVRSENPRVSAHDLVIQALEGVGSGGGHSHMAGGHIEPNKYPGDDVLFRRFKTSMH